METTNNFYSGFAATRARLATLAVTLMAALIGFVTPAEASLQNPLTVSAQTGVLTGGAAGSATYTVTVNRNGTPTATPANPNMTVTGLPVGATYLFGAPSAWTTATGNGSRTYPLTITTSVTTPGGSTTFAAHAAATGSTTRNGNGTLLIAAGPQTINFGPLGGKTFTDPDFNVSATATSGLPVSFAAAGTCSVAGALVHLTGAGSCTITASQAGNASYLAATPVAQVFAIAQGAQTIAFDALADKFIGDAAFNVSATASSGLAVSFAATGDCSVAGNTVTLATPASPPGTCTVTASQAGDTNFTAAAVVPRTFALNTFSGTELYSVSGTAALPGGPVTVWGYNTSNAAVTQSGGPALIVNQGDAVAIRLNNQLAETTALLFQGQAMVPDTTGVAPGASKVYTFTASQPGTFLYEAGPLLGAEHQTAMGLHGALVVRPTGAPLQAYADAATAFTTAADEAVLVFSEIDPALNNAANPAAFDMRDFSPRYFLINGQVYPNTAPIPTVPGSTVLLRYVNAGVQHHSMAVLGLRQNFVAKDAGTLPTLTHNVAAETLAPGQTGDAIATVPATAAAGSKFAVYDGSLKLYNNGDGTAFGGMLTFVTAGTGTGAAGLTTNNVALAPNPTDGTVDVALSATIVSSGSPVTGAEYFIDTPGTAGSGTPFTGVSSGTSVAVSDNLLAATLAGLASGNHTVYVHGTDGPNWGGFGAATLVLDKLGPATTGPTLTPNPSNGMVNVALHATGNDTATGGSNVTAAEYFIGTPGADGTGTAMTVNAPASVASLDAVIAAPVTGGVVSVHSKDAFGHWGPYATITLNVVNAGPTTSGVSAAPNPNNGATPLNSSQPVVRVTATMASTGSTVAGAEGFIDLVGATGTGFPFVPSDGQWNGASEVGTADIPLGTVNALTTGNHTIYVRGRDAAGNWGATSTTILVIDKTPPVLLSVTPAVSTIAFGTGTLSVSATDVGTGLAGGQFWVDGSATPPANPTTFAGTSISLSSVAGGSHTIYVRVRDAANNWSNVLSVSVTVVQAVADAKSFNATGQNGTQTQSYNSNASSLRVNDFPTTGTTALATAPVRIAGGGTATMTVSCPIGGGNTAATPPVGSSTICTNGRFNVNLSDPGGNNANQMAQRRGTWTFTYRITSGAVTSAPATVTITVN